MTEFGRHGSAKDKDVEEAARPELGLVRSVCRQWVVHEDEGLAHRLQKEEFQSHFGHNKKERTIVRGDIKEAKKVQTEEELEIERKHLEHLRQLQLLEERDRQIAQRLQQTLSEDVQPVGGDFYLQDDQALARKLQEEEEAAIRRLDSVPSTSRPSGQSHRVAPQTIYERLPNRRTPRSDIDEDLMRGRNAPVDQQERRRVLQEQKDEELARQLQAMEEQESLASRDYKIAVESQDAEYARLIDEKERERLRKLKDRYSAKKEANLSFEDEAELEQDMPTPRYHPTPPSPRIVQDLTTDFANSSVAARRTISMDGQQRNFSTRGVEDQRPVNIATLIDPTYTPSTSRQAQEAPGRRGATLPALATSARNPPSPSSNTASRIQKSISNK
ncbi:hypothetical protein RvY_17582 [Ramazzottius varieornatus]|uniref:Coiled-coil domain-containing protein n=1 Tax=Ramazzottius varieornatus TaxID=947166 RepID=A0A1D1W2M4_RAMVA|nr:hypothetical protein RvY_17582 [Ramazzottius varieornatus]